MHYIYKSFLLTINMEGGNQLDIDKRSHNCTSGGLF